MIIKGDIDELLKIKDIPGVEIKADLLDFNTKDDELHLAELMVLGRSDVISDKIGKLRLQIGDLILVQGNKESIDLIRTEINDFIILEDYKPNLNLRKKGILTLSFFLLSIILGTTGIMPLAIAFLFGAFLTVAFRCINANEIYEDIDWRLLVLIGGMSAFGIAMNDCKRYA